MAPGSTRPDAESELLAHGAALRRLARQLVGDDPAADDLVQDTYVKALAWPKDAGGTVVQPAYEWRLPPQPA